MQPGDTPEGLSARVRRLEESLGYADRAIEQLSAEIAELGRQLTQARTRVTRLEARLDSVQNPPGAEEQAEE